MSRGRIALSAVTAAIADELGTFSAVLVASGAAFPDALSASALVPGRGHSRRPPGERPSWPRRTFERQRVPARGLGDHSRALVAESCDRPPPEWLGCPSAMHTAGRKAPACSSWA